MLDDFGGNVAAVADRLGMHVSVIYRKLKRWGLDLGVYRDEQRMVSAEGVRTVMTFGTDRLSFGISALSPNALVSPARAESEGADSFACPGTDCAPSLCGMANGGAAVVVDSEALQSIASRAHARKNPLRLAPHLQDRIQRLRLAMQARIGREFSGSMLLDDIVEGAIDSYEAKVLGHAPAPKDGQQ